MIAASLPSPSQGVWYIGPVPLRAYGIIIVIGMIVAVWWTSKRYGRRGGNPELLYDVALWAIPLGIIGARIYHVITSPDSYFGEGGDPLLALQIWKGGLGIWGGVALGAVGAWIAVTRAGMRMGPVADSLAPALLVAQAIGRWGNWFNQELFGSPTTLPWGLQIDDAHLPVGYASGTLFHPTFLYECLWNLTMAALIVWADRSFRFKSGQVFSLYLMAYPLGRCWIEMMRIDTAHSFFGIRLNVWTSLAVFVVGLISFIIAGRLGRSTTLVGEERFTAASQSDEAEAATEASLPVDAAEDSREGTRDGGAGADHATHSERMG